MPNNFLIFCYPRTGSYHLTSLLDSANDITCHGEIFKTQKVELRKWFAKRVSAKSVAERDLDPKLFVDELRATTPKKHFGFKVFQGHVVHTPYLQSLLDDPTWKVISLWREPIEVHASLQRALQTKIWIVKNGSEKNKENLNELITFSPERYDTFLKSYSNFYNLCKLYADRDNGFMINYNQLSDTEVIDQLLDFIGSDAAADELASEYKKQFSLPVYQGFTNPDEAQEYVLSRPFKS